MKSKKSLDRRQFIKNTTVSTVALTVPSIIPTHAFGANDRINTAVL
jgi:hypothetical protein